MNKYLSFIDDEILISEVKKIIDSISLLHEETKRDVFKNSIDPFSALFDTFTNKSTLDDWMKEEATRQLQKTLQNKVGEFHQNILGNCINWELIDDVIDIRSISQKAIAEIKNKHNTTKGSDKKVLYNNLSQFLTHEEYKGFTGYYVEIIPQKPKRYNIPFTPSDNISHARLESREDIRKIDGASFYQLVTGLEDALWQLYNAIPQVIEDVYNVKFLSIKEHPFFKELFQKTFE